jgi:hypothetical protein
MWTTKANADFDRRKQRFEKDRPRELKVVVVNANKYLQALVQGTPPKQIQGGWVHPEPMDVVAITEKGANEILGGKNKARGLIPTRLYLYPEVETETLHTIILGDKTTQSNDIQYCKEYVEALHASRAGGAKSG